MSLKWIKNNTVLTISRRCVRKKYILVLELNENWRNNTDNIKDFYTYNSRTIFLNGNLCQGMQMKTKIVFMKIL